MKQIKNNNTQCYTNVYELSSPSAYYDSLYIQQYMPL